MTGRPVARYASKVDRWLGIVLVAVPVIVVASAIALTFSGAPGVALIGWLSVAGVAALYVALVWPVVYELHEEALVIRFGRVRWPISYGTIREVRPSRSLLASPALSLDRLAIDVGGLNPTTISPADRDAFLRDLSTRTPHLRREGDRLVAA